MPSLIEVIEQRTNAAINNRDVWQPRKSVNGLAVASSGQSIQTIQPLYQEPTNGDKVTHLPSTVDAVMKTKEVEAYASLMKLRELVVGPSQQLNEARLEELVKIFDERETKWVLQRKEMLARSEGLEALIRQENLNQLQVTKSEIVVLIDSMAAEAQNAVMAVREELSVLRREAHALVENSNAITDQKLEVQKEWAKSHMDGNFNKMLSEMEKWIRSFEAHIEVGQREIQQVLSRAFKEASESLARNAN